MNKKKTNKRKKTFDSIWIERLPNPKPGKGIAEIYVNGGRTTTVKKTCVGRIFGRHLSEEVRIKLISTIEKALLDTFVE